MAPMTQSEEPRKPEPRRAEKRCTDADGVSKGDTVRFWLPINGATDTLLNAEVLNVARPRDGEDAPRLHLGFRTKAGEQEREDIAYAGQAPSVATRTNRWSAFDPPPKRKK